VVLPLVKKPAARVGPTGHFRDWARLDAGGAIQFLEPGIPVRLEQAGEARHVRRRMRGGAIGAVEIRSGRGGTAAKRPVVAHIDPEPPGLGPAEARCQHRNRRVVAVDLLGREHVGADGRHDRIEQPGRLSHPIAQRRAVKLQTFAGIDLALAIQRQVVGVFRHQQVRQHGRCSAAARRRHRRGGRLGNGIARPAGKFRPDVADDLKMPRHVIQHLGHVLAELSHAAAAGGAGAGFVTGGLVHHLLAGQMIGQRLAFRLGADGNERRRIVGFGAHGIFGLAGLQLLELQFQLLDLTGDPLR
jgi:hypothetical protein